MGWWSQDDRGNSFEGDGSMVWGDEPADAFADALDRIVAAFRHDVGRPPTIEEIRAGLAFSTLKQQSGPWDGRRGT